ncbi:hypothetical protein EDB89DRAFT_720846 [Lactarius sanguifluus]|nr:hypothetical protein EDB89DRAFT_720846 [Lactarius sanguifluus]
MLGSPFFSCGGPLTLAVAVLVLSASSTNPALALGRASFCIAQRTRLCPLMYSPRFLHSLAICLNLILRVSAWCSNSDFLKHNLTPTWHSEHSWSEGNLCCKGDRWRSRETHSAVKQLSPPSEKDQLTNLRDTGTVRVQ